MKHEIRPCTIRSAVAIVPVLLLAACVTHRSYPPIVTPVPVATYSITTASDAGMIIPLAGEACQRLAGLDDSGAAHLLDMPLLQLLKLKTLSASDAIGVCLAGAEAQRALLIADRNSRRPPKAVRQQNRAVSKEYMLRWDADDRGRQPNATQILGAELDRKRLASFTGSIKKAAGIGPNQWTDLGPRNVGGRVRAMVIDPRNPNRIFAGSASGGIWRSIDAGATWVPLIDLNGNLSVGALAFDPTNPDVMYFGSGESYQALVGVGMFKSTDGGNSWNFLASTSTDTTVNPQGSRWQYVNRIAVSNSSSNIVLAATDGGIFRSVDAGQSWTRVYSRQTFDLQFDPLNPSNLVAGLNSGTVAYSRDAGATWLSPATPLIAATNGARAEVAFARSKANVVYVSLNNREGEIWKSLDGGQTWALVSNPKHLEKQGDYDNTIWVDPFDDAHLVVGGIDLYRSVDGGQNFTKISDWGLAGPGLPQPHADHHVIVAPPNYSAANPVLYIGNDGGVFRATDITRAARTGTSTWQNLSTGLNITQFYGGAGRVAAGGKIVGGTQDNGDVQVLAGVNWAEVGGGDGGYSAVDPINDDVRYGEYVFASIRRFVTGQPSRDICVGITEGNKDICGAGATQKANFIAPFILDPNERARMLVGADSLWVSDDVRTQENPVWRAIKPPVVVPGVDEHFINAIDVARGNVNLVWVGHNATNDPSIPSQLYKSVNAQSATPTWQLMTQAGMPSAAVNRITIDPDNANRVWVVYGGFATDRVWVTENGGTSWRSISNGLPSVALFDIKRHPTERSWLYVAAANGIYTSENAGVSWNAANEGPNGVRVRELFWYDAQTLVAVTFGRGMWKTSVATPVAPPPAAVSLSRRGGVDFDGLGRSQLVLRNSAGQSLAARLVNDAFAFVAIGDPGEGFNVIAAGDLDGNGKSDLVYRTQTADSSGRVTVNAWKDFQPSSNITLRLVKPEWQVQASADLDGDGFGDLLFRWTGDDGIPNNTGVSFIWFQGAGGAYNAVRKRGGAPLSWSMLGAMDLNGDGSADMLYLSPAGQLRALMATPGRTCANLSAGSVPSGFAVLKYADFTGNRRGDLLIRDASGAMQLISLNGAGLTLPPYTGDPDDQNAACTGSTLTVASTTRNLPASDSTWAYYASGDFNGDGIWDIVWLRPNGALAVWLMNANGTPTVINNAGTVPAGGYAPIPLQ